MMLFFSCHKERLDNGEPCKALPQLEGVYTADNSEWEIRNEGIPYEKVSFNPNNPDEILITVWGGERRLVKYNLVTKEKKDIIEIKSNCIPKWGTNDKILFTDGYYPNSALYMINSNGDSLKKLSSVQCNSFDWNNTGDRIVSYGFGILSGNDYFHYFYIQDTEGNYLDSIPGGGSNLNWQFDSLITYSKDFDIYTLNPYTHEKKILIGERASWVGFSWIDKDHILWSGDGKYYITNIQTQENKIIKDPPPCMGYYSFSYSPALNKIIAIRREQWLIENKGSSHIFGTRTRIVMMNLDGSEEEELDPEL